MTRTRLIQAATVLCIFAAAALWLRLYTSAPAALPLPPLEFVQRYTHKGCGPFGFLTLNPCFKYDFYTVDKPFEEFSPSVVSALQAQGYFVNYDSDPRKPTYAFKDGQQLYIDFDTVEFSLDPADRPDARLIECVKSEKCSVITIQF